MTRPALAYRIFYTRHPSIFVRSTGRDEKVSRIWSLGPPLIRFRVLGMLGRGKCAKRLMAELKWADFILRELRSLGDKPIN